MEDLVHKYWTRVSGSDKHSSSLLKGVNERH